MKNAKKISSKSKAKYEFNEQEMLNFEKFTLKMQEEAHQSLQCEESFLKQTQKELLQQIEQEKLVEEELIRQIQEADNLNKEIVLKYEQVLETKIGLVITSNERVIQSNIKNMKQIQKNIQEKIYDKMQLQEQLDKLDQHILIHQSQYGQILRSVQNSRAIIKVQLEDEMRSQKMIRSNEAQLQEMFHLKKRLNNQLQDIKGNIRVYCRIRPAKSQKTVIKATSENTLKLTLQRKSPMQTDKESYEQNFLFQHIFNENETQSQVFDQIAQLVQNSIDGKNVCIFAYGQTGSGKTFTLLGPSEEEKISLEERKIYQGLTPRSIQLIFKQISNNNSFKWKYKIVMSIQEIYLDTIIDLIAKSQTTMDNIKEVQVSSIQSVQIYLRDALSARKTAQTNMNLRSSRSHLIVTLKIQGQNLANNEMRNGSLTFIDLAGSERLKQSKVQGDVLKQTLAINKSLSALGNVINGIRKHSQHIPYRNSKLTHVLQKYLQGDSKTLMFVNISPDTQDSFQTKISLSFAQGVRQCKLNKK